MSLKKSAKHVWQPDLHQALRRVRPAVMRKPNPALTVSETQQVLHGAAPLTQTGFNSSCQTRFDDISTDSVWQFII